MNELFYFANVHKDLADSFISIYYFYVITKTVTPISITMLQLPHN